jgi:hypothetical protein
MLPETFMPLAAALVPCFTAPTYRTFCFLVAGWVHCVGRHTVTRVALAAGVVGTMGERGWLSGWHISVCHRFFARATWNLDHLGLMVFRLALRWVPTDGTDQALVVLVDDTLARKGGKAIALGSMHHDPLLSSVRKAFSSFGHVWVVLALWVPLPFGPRGGAKGVALPLLFRLYVGSKRGNRADAASGGARRTSGSRYRRAEAAFPPPERRPTKPQLAREELALVGQWAAAFAPERTVYVVGDTAYTNRTTMEGRPANVQVVGHMRVDAALFGPPPPRQPGQRGRSRTRGARLPTPQAMATTRGARGTWHRLRLVLYGKTVTPLVFRGTALWYGALRESPVRFVVVRDPSGRRRDEAFFCTDLTVSVCFLLETYAKRWALEVTFFDCKQSLGFEDPQNQTARAVRRTAPFAALVYTLVALWGAHEVAAGRAPRWVSRPWYRHKATLAFTDLLTAFRQASVCRAAHAAPPIAAAPCPPRRPRKSRPCARALVGAFTRRP